MSRASESLIGAWANSCRVRGRLSLLMMAPSNSSKACSIRSISSEQDCHGTSTDPYMLQEIIISLQQPYMGKLSRLAAECCLHKLFIGVEGRGFPECLATWRRWRFHPKPPMTFYFMYEYRPIPPLSRHHIELVPEYSNVGGSHHSIAGQSVFHLYDQRCSALSSWRQHIASVRSGTFYAP